MTAGFLAAITVVAFAGAKLPRMGRRRLPGQSNPMSRVAAERENILLGGWLVQRFRLSPRRFNMALPGVLDEIVRSLSSGATWPDALHEAQTTGGPVAEDLALVAADTNAGAPLGEALERWSVRRPETHVDLVVAAVDLALVSGGEPADLLAGVAEALRDEEAVAAEARALATQARASAGVVALAPLAFAVLTAPFRSGGLVGGGTAGWILLIGLALDGLGLWWMWRITSFSGVVR